MSETSNETFDERIARYAAKERATRIASMCEHMRDFVEYGAARGVSFGGCGECGSPWMSCKQCGKEESDFGQDSSELVSALGQEKP